MREAHEEIYAIPHEPDDALERTVAAMMLWSNSTHLASFGSASVWPVYLSLGNQLKYVHAKPSAGALHHLAYIPLVCMPLLLLHYLLTVYLYSFPILFKRHT